MISLRLVPANVRLDLCSPSCWRPGTRAIAWVAAVNRRVRRGELAAVAARIRAVPRGVPLLVGGDFNAPAGDAIFRLLRPRLRDTWREAGAGWGNTILNAWTVFYL